MGFKNKGLLLYQGEPFIRHLVRTLSVFQETLLSANNNDYSFLNLPVVTDEQRGLGPLGGLLAGLQQVSNSWMFVTGCDTPLLDRELINYLKGYLASDYDAVVTVDHSGTVHPLCGFYHQDLIPVIQNHLQQQRYKMQDFLKTIRTKYVDLGKTIFNSSRLLMNINTEEDLLRLNFPKVVAICGTQNAGKTTLICELIHYFKTQELTVATIKHTSHDYPLDVEGKDSFLHREAGSSATAVFSPYRYMINENSNYHEDYFLHLFSNYDIILMEGFKDSDYPKLEVIRQSNSPVSKKNLLACICDNPVEHILTIPRTDTESIAQLILKTPGWMA